MGGVALAVWERCISMETGSKSLPGSTSALLVNSLFSIVCSYPGVSPCFMVEMYAYGQHAVANFGTACVCTR